VIDARLVAHLQSIARAAAGIAAVVVVGALLWSGLSSFRTRWDAVGTQRVQWAPAPAIPNDLRFMNGLYDTSIVEFWRDHLRRGDLYYFNVPPSSASFPDLPSGLSLFAGYALLPAQRVLRPDQASVILTADVDPALPGIRYTSTIKNGHAAVSRVIR
jgi:hypothetical protein